MLKKRLRTQKALTPLENPGTTITRTNRMFLTGFTLTELAITAVICTVVILGIGFVLADNQRGWNRMYDRVYADVVTDGYVARKTFDNIIRKASREKFLLDDAGSWIEIYYYINSDSAVTDGYTRFYYDSGNSQLKFDYGNWNPDDPDPRDLINTRIVCSDVSSCIFKVSGRSVQMVLTLDDGSQMVTTTSSAVMHSE